eukprot:6711434-Karenia_brevis.AAC.1
MESKISSQSSTTDEEAGNRSAPPADSDAKDKTMSDAAPKKCCLAQMCYDKSKSGPQDDQW